MKQTNRQIIDRGLFLYGGLVAVVLTTIAILNLRNTNSLVTLILFLPVSIYFIARAVIILFQNLHHFLNRDLKRHPYFGDFSLNTFLGQNNTLFLITQLLLALAFSITLFKISLLILR